MGKGPEQSCDVVMKGGITSGVVYPGVIDVLREKYRFKSIGGTSAGAIAAAALAAAEYRRQGREDEAGFEMLRKLPAELGQTGPGGDSRLFTLFAPSPRTRRLFGVLTSLLRREWSETKTDEPLHLKLGRVLRASLGAYWGVPVASVLATALIIFLSLPVASLAPWTFIYLLLVTLLLALLLTLLTLIMAAAWDVQANLVPNHLGLCTGSTGEGEAFSDWLETYLDSVAGLEGAGPLTFAQLRSQSVELRMFTTCVSRGIPLTVPFHQKAIYFKPRDLEGFFSPRLIAYLKTHARASESAVTYNERLGLTDPDEKLYALPHHDNLPVVMAVRLSMSFPILFSAVPLYMRKYSAPVLEQDEVVGTLEFERAYFIDGGICSNFPIDFFDKPLPNCPTFAIDLEPTPGVAPEGEDEQTWIPDKNSQGVLPPWKNFGQGRGFGRLLGYLSAMYETGFTWRDTYQSLAAASRDRICHIKVYGGSNEGGLNLQMDEALITRLSERGRQGGARILRRFHSDYGGEGWRNHRWQRFRNILSAQATFLSTFGARYTNEAVKPTFENLMDDPPSARLNEAQRDYVKTQLDRLVDYIEGAEAAAEPETGADFHRGAPRPASSLKTVTDPTVINLG